MLATTIDVAAQLPEISAPAEGESATIWLLGVVVAMLVTVVGYLFRNSNRTADGLERLTNMLAEGALVPAEQAANQKRITRALESATAALNASARAQTEQTAMIHDLRSDIARLQGRTRPNP